MLIACPDCATQYLVARETLAPDGRAIRCDACGLTWFAEPEAVEIAPAPETALPPEPSPDVVAAPITIEAPAPTAPLPARRPSMRRPPRVLPGWAIAVAALLAADVMLIAGRHEVVRLFPQTAGLYARLRLPVNLRGTTIGAVKVASEAQDGVPVLTVSGVVANRTGHAVGMPRLRFALQSEDGHDIYTWTAPPPRERLAPLQSATFHSKLAAPPGDARRMVVRFVTGNDVVAGLEPR